MGIAELVERLSRDVVFAKRYETAPDMQAVLRLALEDGYTVTVGELAEHENILALPLTDEQLLAVAGGYTPKWVPQIFQ